MKTETMIRDEYGNPKVIMHETEAPGFEARIALALAERWGLVAAEVDGEDSAGRSKLRRLTPKELASHACEAAQELVSEFAARGWMIQLPSIAEHMATQKLAEERKAEERRIARAQ
jgi:hypothetical protein